MSTMSTFGAPGGGRSSVMGGYFVFGSLASYVVSPTCLGSGMGNCSRARCGAVCVPTAGGADFFAAADFFATDFFTAVFFVAFAMVGLSEFTDAPWRLAPRPSWSLLRRDRVFRIRPR